MKLKAIDKLPLQNLLSTDNGPSLKLAAIIRDILKEDDRSQEQAFKNLQGCKQDKYMRYVSAFCSLFGIGTKEDIEAARREMPSNPSDRFYQHLWGVICERSNSPTEVAKSYDWHKKAATQGHNGSIIALWLLYDAEHPSAMKDHENLIKIFKEAAKKGYVISKIFLGLLHGFGEGVAHDTKEAGRLLEEYGHLLDKDKDLVALISIFCLERSDVKKEGKLVSFLQMVHAIQLLSGQNVNRNEEMGNRLLDLIEKHGHIVGASMVAHIFMDRGEFERALRIFQEAARQGVGLGEAGLGRMYQTGQGMEKDLVVAREWFAKAAAHEDKFGQTELGIMCLRGEGGDKDLKRALEEFGKASEQNHGRASYFLGLMHENGEGVTVDLVTARKWYVKGSEQGDAEAQNKLGEMCLHGRGGERDLKRALEEFGKASERGLGMASYTLAITYEQGCEGVAVDLVTARKWYEKSSEQGLGMASRNLAIMYETGNGVAVDLVTARKWYVKGSEQGDAEAQNKLGEMCLHGRGGEQDVKRALEEFRKASVQGLGIASRNMAIICENGHGVTVNLVHAREWYERSSEQGNAEAQNKLGEMCLHGRGGKQDVKRALEEFEKASKQGLGAASCTLGGMYQKGTGVAVDLVAARKWYATGSEQGHVEAQFLLAMMCVKGQGGEEDFKRAKEEFEKVAKQEKERCSSSEFNLGEIYRAGLGVEADLVAARSWYTKSANRGLDVAQKALARMCQRGQGGEKDLEMAFDLLKKVLDSARGKVDQKVRQECVAVYEEGLKQATDRTKVREWHQRGATIEDERAQNSLALMCWHGDGGPVNLQEAHTLFQKAARKNHSGALNNLGVLYGQGEGVEQDLKIAADYFRRASEMGSILGHVNNGLVQVEFGNIEEAYGCYQKAVAAQGLSDPNANNKSPTLVFSAELSKSPVNQQETPLEQPNSSNHKLIGMTG